MSNQWTPEMLRTMERLRKLPHDEAVRQMLADESLRDIENDDNWPAESGEIRVDDVPPPLRETSR